jgi:hypothetical protein
MKSFLAIHSLVAFYTLADAYSLSIYGGLGCRGQTLGKREMKVDSGCQRDFAGNGASALIAADDKDLGNVIVFFEGDDCKPSNIMNNGTAFEFESKCWTGNYGSYEVWDLWKV